MKKFIIKLFALIAALSLCGSSVISADYENSDKAAIEFLKNMKISYKISSCKNIIFGSYDADENNFMSQLSDEQKQSFYDSLDINSDSGIDVMDIVRYKHEMITNGNYGEDFFEDTSEEFYFDIPDSDNKIAVVEDSFLLWCSDDVFIEYPDGTRIKIGWFSGDDGYRPLQCGEYEITFSDDNTKVIFDYSMEGNENDWVRKIIDIPQTNPVIVSDADELKSALANAKPNDEIILKQGIYQTDKKGKKASLFMGSADGTEHMPIIIRSEYSEYNAMLMGNDPAENIVLYITGDYWIIRELDISNAQKGIVLDNSNHSVIDECSVFSIGSEAIHLRDGSSYCTVKNSYIHDTGIISPEYGEGVYIGSAKSTSGYDYKCDYNMIQHCRFENIAAEHVDIKEFTTGTTVENCDMYGKGISGKNYADSFIDIKGNNAVICGNYCDSQGNDIIADAFQLHVVADGWGYDNEVHDNRVKLDNPEAYIISGWDGSVTVYNNERIPAEGNFYYGDAVTEK